RHTHARLSALLAHEHAPLALAQRCSDVPASTPLFSALLNYRHNDGPPETLAIPFRAALEGIDMIGFEERTNYPLTLSIDNNGDSLTLDAQAVAPISSERICTYMHQALDSLANALESAPAMPVDQLDILPHDERKLLLESFNATSAPFAQHACIHQLFEEQVRRSPDAIAVVFADTMLTYAALNARANQLAHRLIGLGVTPDTRVGLCVERSPEMVISLLAILKSGGAYVPLDPKYSGERLASILNDAAPLLLVADDTGRAALRDTSSYVVLDPHKPLALSTDDPRIPELTSRNLAYVIYTSGSTGTPKGVMIEHRQTVNLLTWAQRNFTFDALRNTLFSTSINFDLSVFECFLPLSRGASVCLVDNALSLVRQPRSVSLINAVPSAIKSLLAQHALKDIDLSTLNLAGEPLTTELIRQIFEQSRVQRLCNLYGPSETTTYSTWKRIKRDDAIVDSIGRPIDNTRIYLLDAAGRPVPMGAIGEIYIGGAGVARGYLNRPELTAERFLADPFSDEPDARMYRTGDLARYLPDGN
ncbi:non-ribosomal peptide synthetase, partial [Caballeronia cordobensis]|uniref:non-ribosomal peptide synthetase n=1 Tax=Caballeronia cordobensis TaxID=1353886 RepID=UPI000B1959A6